MLRKDNIIVSTINAEMCGYQIIREVPTRTTGDIYQDTMAVNACRYTLAEFRLKFVPELRRKMIAEFLSGEELEYPATSPDDYTARKFEQLLMRELQPGSETTTQEI